MLGLEFKVYSLTDYGQYVKICGNTPQLGSWQPFKALKLYTDSTLYPQWHSLQAIRVRGGTKIQFKLCIMNQHGNLERWQQLQNNRLYYPQNNLCIVIRQNQSSMVYEPMDSLARFLTSRKKTKDILNDLSSDESDKQPWQNYIQQKKYEQKSLVTELIDQMKQLIQTQCESGFEIKPLQYNHSSSSHESIQNLDQLNILHCIIIEQNEQVKVYENKNKIELTINSISNIKQFNNKQLIIIHINYKNIQFNTYLINKIKQQIKNENILININIQEKIIISNIDIKFMIQNYIQWIIIKNQQIFNNFINYFQYNCYDIKIINKFIQIKLSLKRSIYLIYITNQENNNIFIIINQQINLQKNKQTNLKLNDQFTSLIRKNDRIIITLCCESLDEISIRSRSLLVDLSSCQGVEIYLIVQAAFIDINIKLPMARTDHMIVMNSCGEIYGNGTYDQIQCIYQLLNFERQKFKNTYDMIISYLPFGYTHHISVHNQHLMIQFHHNKLGNLVKAKLIARIHKLNKQIIFKVISTNTGQSSIIIMPFCVSNEFYYQTIANYKQNISTLWININYQSKFDSFNYVHTLQQIYSKCTLKQYNVDQKRELTGLKKYQSINDCTLQKIFQQIYYTKKF